MSNNGSRQQVALHAGCRQNAVSRVQTRANAHNGACENSCALILCAVHDTHTMTSEKPDKTQEVGRGPTAPLAQGHWQQNSWHARFASESEVVAASVAGN